MNRQGLDLQIREYILQSPTDKIGELTIQRIAVTFKVNPCLLSRMFKRAANVLLSTFLENERFKRARKLLREEQRLTVRQVAQIVGYESEDYFRKKFKNRYGLTPGQYKWLKKKIKIN